MSKDQEKLTPAEQAKFDETCKNNSAAADELVGKQQTGQPVEAVANDITADVPNQTTGIVFSDQGNDGSSGITAPSVEPDTVLSLNSSSCAPVAETADSAESQPTTNAEDQSEPQLAAANVADAQELAARKNEPVGVVDVDKQVETAVVQPDGTVTVHPEPKPIEIEIEIEEEPTDNMPDPEVGSTVFLHNQDGVTEGTVTVLHVGNAHQRINIKLGNAKTDHAYSVPAFGKCPEEDQFWSWSGSPHLVQGAALAAATQQ